MKTASLTLSGKRSTNVKILARFADKVCIAASPSSYIETKDGFVGVADDRIVVELDDLDRVAALLTEEFPGDWGRVQIHGVSDKYIATKMPLYHAAYEKYSAGIIKRGIANGCYGPAILKQLKNEIQ